MAVAPILPLQLLTHVCKNNCRYTAADIERALANSLVICICHTTASPASHTINTFIVFDTDVIMIRVPRSSMVRVLGVIMVVIGVVARSSGSGDACANMRVMVQVIRGCMG